MNSHYSTNVLNSLSQCPTPLNTLFFSAFNIEQIQRGIHKKIKETTGYSIDRQKAGDLIAIMRTVFITNSTNGYNNACPQVEFMNERTIDMAVSQINTGLAQYMGYLRDIESVPVPLDLPKNENSYGLITDINTRIGM